MIVGNDFAGDPDSVIALGHQLLTPKTVVPLVTESPLNLKVSTLDGISGERSNYHDRTAQTFLGDGTCGAVIEGYTIDVRLTHADFMAKLRLHATGMAICCEQAVVLTQKNALHESRHRAQCTARDGR